MSNKKDYSGQIFGLWNVIEKLPVKDGITKYLCKCSCEKETTKEVRASNLISGISTSCGCKLNKTLICRNKNENNVCNSIDLTGQVFGLLTVIERIPKYNGKTRTYYKCICSCKEENQNEIIVRSDNLVSGATKSCNCLHIGFQKGGKHYNWKGGVREENIALYETYAQKMSLIEETRNDPENIQFLQVRCTYCGKWHNPKANLCTKRIAFLNGISKYENRFYCSEECKQNCPIYGQNKFPKGYKKATSREVNPELRKEVFKRDEWTCQRCESTKSLHCHHIGGIVQQPMLSNDPDNCITLCKMCHKWVHSKEGCSYYDYRCNK